MLARKSSKDKAFENFELLSQPEPSTWVAGALALAALGYSQRKRVAKKLSAGQVLKRA
jgi:hypothetical protein